MMKEFTIIYKKYYSELYRFSLYLCRDEENAKDLCSESFIRAFTSPTEKKMSSIRSYLFKIAHNLYRSKRRIYHVDINDEARNIPERDSFSPVVEEIEDILSQFPENDRLLFALFAYHGLSYKEISETLKLSLASVKVNIHRLRKKIQDEFKEEK